MSRRNSVGDSIKTDQFLALLFLHATLRTNCISVWSKNRVKAVFFYIGWERLGSANAVTGAPPTSFPLARSCHQGQRRALMPWAALGGAAVACGAGGGEDGPEKVGQRAIVFGNVDNYLTTI